MRAALLLLVATIAAGCERQPDRSGNASQNWARARPVSGFPLAEELEIACAEAARRRIAEAEAQGMIIDHSFHQYPVRSPRCRWANGAGTVAICDFEQAEIYIDFPTGEQRTQTLRRMRESDWKPYGARLEWRRGAWVIPQGCHPVPGGRRS